MSDDMLGLTTQIVAAHIASNKTAANDIPDLIRSVYKSLSTVGAVEEPVTAQTPAVPLKKSVFPQFIVCLEDGKKLKMLKRHLKTSYNMTPDDYRAKWNLPRDYPMVAPAYSAKRSSLAKDIGLGRKPAGAAAEQPVVQQIPARKARGAKG